MRKGHTIAELQQLKAVAQPSTGGDFEAVELGTLGQINEILAASDVGDALSPADKVLLGEEIQRRAR